MSEVGLGRVKTKSDLVVMPSGRQIFAFFALRMTVKPKIPGAVIPRRVFTWPGSWSCNNSLGLSADSSDRREFWNLRIFASVSQSDTEPIVRSDA